MAATVTGIEITGLHGYKNIAIKINSNRIVLVGGNGIGKTTVMNLLYYFLTAQWKRLSEYDFETIVVEINQKKHLVKREEILFAREFRSEVFRHDTHDFEYRAKKLKSRYFVTSLIGIFKSFDIISTVSRRIFFSLMIFLKAG
jgi:predicted ATP-dependent endonuclease of OLD family